LLVLESVEFLVCGIEITATFFVIKTSVYKERIK